MGNGISTNSSFYNFLSIIREIIINSNDKIENPCHDICGEYLYNLLNNETFEENELLKLCDNNNIFLLLLRYYSIVKNIYNKDDDNFINFSKGDNFNIFTIDVTECEVDDEDDEDNGNGNVKVALKLLFSEYKKQLNKNSNIFDYSIIAECAGLSDLSIIKELENLKINSSNIMISRLRILNIASNSLTNNIISTIPNWLSTQPLGYLNIGGNGWNSMTSISSSNKLPSCLVVLDLSYTESIIFEPGCFLYVPQLLRLVLDGCNIKTTVPNNIEKISLEPSSNNIITVQQGIFSSIFYGLVSLQELSLKENCLTDVETIKGIFWFNLKYIISKSPILPTATLQHIWLAENSFSSTETILKQINKELINNLPILLTIDDISTNCNVNKVDHAEIMNIYQRSKDSNDKFNSPVIPLYNKNGMDEMDKEFSMVMKGEKDNTVTK